MFIRELCMIRLKEHLFFGIEHFILMQRKVVQLYLQQQEHQLFYIQGTQMIKKMS